MLKHELKKKDKEQKLIRQIHNLDHKIKITL
jgi:hypothetical protein